MTLRPDTEPNDDSRRLRIVNIDKYAIMMLFSEPIRECIVLNVRPQLPAGYAIRNVCYASERDCFSFLVEHPSFDPVPVGQMVPWDTADMTFKRTVAIREEDGRYRVKE